MSEDLLDVNEFMERVQDDKELLLELLDIFLADYMEKRKTLQEAVDGQDFEQIKGVAHSLKGASGNISAKSMCEIFSSLEEMGKNSVCQVSKLSFHILKVGMNCRLVIFR